MKIGLSVRRHRLFIASLGVVLGLACGCARLDALTAPRVRSNADAVAREVQRIHELASRWENEPVPVGVAPQVFYDDALILSRSTGVVRRIARATKLFIDDPMIAPDRSWEGGVCGVFISAVTNRDGTLQIWYDCGSTTYGKIDAGSYVSIGYAESSDGLEWHKPMLLPQLNNIVLRPAFGVGIYRDDRDTRRAHRYKAVYGSVGMHGVDDEYGLTFAHSANGTRWSMYPDTEKLDDVRSDTLSSLFWDDEIGQYRVYSRTIMASGRSSRFFVRPYVGTSWSRMILSALLLPVGHKPWLHVSDSAAPKAGELYAMTVYKYGGLYIGQIGLYAPDGRIYYTLALSRDGARWDYQYATPQQALVPHGNPGAFDAGIIFPPSTPPVELGDDWMLYYGATEIARGRLGVELPTRPYHRSIGLAKIRKEGHFFLENTEDSGEIVSKSFVLMGNRIDLNVDASEGSVVVEVYEVKQTGEDRLLATSEKIEASATRAPCRWVSGGIDDCKGKAVRIRFALEGRVRLYGVQVSGNS